GRARFVPASRPWPGYAAAVERQRKRYRFWINNGRSNHIWQTLYHHQHIGFYQDRIPMPYVEMHPDDARELGIASGDLVELENDVGNVRARALRPSVPALARLCGRGRAPAQTLSVLDQQR
ncbi:molybdopterin dinucleotide binding domain-containing protein, partial [Streptococcus pneumoniae]|uniref:molybdopterin dinucleotide binding domain-containing protein n=1 Tax=Streptococcus pneumoniae TaxID=1313 RepID=UPI00125B0D26